MARDYQEDDILESMLSHDQQVALSTMLSGKNCFLTGFAGTGKTTVIQLFRKRYQGNCAVVAPTGIAALNAKGQTIHSFFMLAPGLLNPESIDDIPWARKKEMIRQTNCIIIDEISMVRSDMFAAIDLRLRQCARGANKRKPFGGKQIIACGDFFQLPPVVSTQLEDDWLKENLGGEFAFETELWRDAKLEVINLKTPFRQDDAMFLKILNNIRHGDLDQADILLDGVEETAVAALNKVCAVEGKKMPRTPIRLCTTNREAQAVNNEARARIDAPPVKFEAVVTGKFAEADYPTESQLVLKVGCRVMVLCNLHKPKGGFFYVNGDCGTVLEMQESGDLPKVKVALDNGNVVWITSHEWSNMKYVLELDRLSGKKKIRQEVIGTFLQMPLRLAYATTIHKSQGMTLDCVELHLGNGCFAHGQLYTALSRAKSLAGLKLERKIFNEDLILDQRVVDFYISSSFEDPLCALDGSGGERSQDSSTKKLEVPASMYDKMKEMLDAMKSRSQSNASAAREVASEVTAL